MTNIVPETPMRNQIEAEIKEMNLGIEVEAWLNENIDNLSEIIDVYVKNPDTFGLSQPLRDEPILILKTILFSAETLYKYQKEYNAAMQKLAEVNGIEYTNLEDVPEMLEQISIEREKVKLHEHMQEGGTVAIGLLGIGASGKGTIGKLTGMPRAVNFTTRPMRPTEQHGEDYFYIDQMEPNIRELDKDTGFNIIGRDEQGNPIYEKDEQGKTIDYFAKYGPYIVTVHRPGRARHGTAVAEFEKFFNQGIKTIFFEHGPVQLKEAGEKIQDILPQARVLPVCILAPKSGILPLAARIAVRTYGDPVHKDPKITEGYKINDTYMESTIGLGQIQELKSTADFMEGESPLGVAYIVNDNLHRAAGIFKGLIS